VDVRFAYADPPYLGRCHYYGHHHEAPYGCWDDPMTHVELLNYLDREYDGWAYSMSSSSLSALAQWVPSARVGAWDKPFASFKPGQRVPYVWEPVLFKTAKQFEDAPWTRDFLVEPMSMKRGVTGAKPEAFCRWVLDLLGYQDDDEFTDLFPGSGIMDGVRAQLRLPI